MKRETLEASLLEGEPPWEKLLKLLGGEDLATPALGFSGMRVPSETTAEASVQNLWLSHLAANLLENKASLLVPLRDGHVQESVAGTNTEKMLQPTSISYIRGGPYHAPRFKASVNFNGELFESPFYCSTLR